MRPALVIGVTGGIGSGKTTVANLFAALGVPVIDADDLARKVVAPGQAAYEAIVQRFGTSVLSKSGELDRRRLREQVFSDPDSRVELEAIVHPRVYAEIEQQLNKLSCAYAVVVVPLLIETGATSLVDRVLVVDASEDTQIQRASRRDGTTPDTIRRILAVQSDRESRLAAADDIIENDGSEQSLEQSVSAVHRRYLDLAARIASKQP